MPACTSRTGTYKLGLFFFYFAFCLFMVGCLAPFWARISFEVDDTQFWASEGPWVICISYRSSGMQYSQHARSSCVSLSSEGANTWFHAVRILESIAFILLLVAFIYSIAVNCCKNTPGPRARKLEVMVIVGGLFALHGAIVYGASRPNKHPYSNPTSGFTASSYDTSSSTPKLVCEIDWAVYITGVGGALLLASATVIALGNKPVGPAAMTGGVVLGMPSDPRTGFENPGYPGYVPTQPGCPVRQPGSAAQDEEYLLAEGAFAPSEDPPIY